MEISKSLVNPDVSLVLDRPISRFSLAEALQVCEDRARQSQGGFICFANVHTVTESKTNVSLAEALNTATYSFADGVPLIWASKLKGTPIRSRVCGPDFMAFFLERTRDLTQGLIGGQSGQAEKLAERFGLENAICHSPPVRAFSAELARQDWEEFLAKCPKRIAPPVVWVGLGAPKQELWCKTISALAPKTLFFAVGAAFDFLTDTKVRAPKWMQNNGLEWAHRLGSEPGRLWKRYLVTNSQFVAHSLAETVKSILR